MKKRDFIAEDIFSKIYQNKYKAGEKLPTERELSDLYTVSRYTIREALKKLVNIGCIKVIQGSGIFVSETRYKSPLIYNSLTEKNSRISIQKLCTLKKSSLIKSWKKFLIYIWFQIRNYGSLNG